MRINKSLFAIFGVCLIILSLYFLLFQKPSFFCPNKATLYLELRNESDKTLELSAFVYVDMDLVKFSNTTITPLTRNFLVGEIEDASGIELYAKNFQPRNLLILKIENITVTPRLSLNLSGVELNIRSITFNESDIGYKAVFSIYNSYGLSIGSRYFFTVRLNQYNQWPRYEDRTNLTGYLNALLIVTFLAGVALILLATEKEIMRWFPFASMFLVWITLFLYIFLGSGPEINTMTNLKGPFSAISFLIHGYNKHINDNLVYFTLLSVLFESFIKIRGKSIERDLVKWYSLPLISPGLLGIFEVIKQGEFGFGLSYSIEIMTWALWAYIISRSKELIKSKLQTLMAILSGIPSFVFIGWLVYFLFGYYATDPYYRDLALDHIFIGVVSAVFIVLTIFGKEIWDFSKSKMLTFHK
jgi:hypothetical protein